MVDFAISAKARNDVGKGASRRLRQADELPAIVYGGEKAPQMLALSHNELFLALGHQAFYSHIITLSVDGVAEDVILKDLQRHPVKPRILHADFQRVSKTHKLHTRVPLHFINEDTAIGVKEQGGMIAHSMTELEIECLPADLPEYIEIDLASLKMGDILHISDIQLPAGVTSVALAHGADHDLPVAAIHKPRGAVASDETGGDTTST
ncbi:MAG: 50S ribosomal protein L25/general stress protein Ctc [Porticoccaceae bacterium]